MSVDPERVQALFLAVVDRPIADRNAFLDRECNGDKDLRNRTQALLAAHDLPGSFLEAAAVGIGPTVLQLPVLEGVGTQIGPYKLREVLGEGGMGIVCAAEQEHPVRRKVALKVITPGMDT